MTFAISHECNFLDHGHFHEYLLALIATRNRTFIIYYYHGCLYN